MWPGNQNGNIQKKTVESSRIQLIHELTQRLEENESPVVEHNHMMLDVIENMPYGVVVFDDANGTVMFADGKAKKLFKNDSVVGDHIDRYIKEYGVEIIAHSKSIKVSGEKGTVLYLKVGCGCGW